MVRVGGESHSREWVPYMMCGASKRVRFHLIHHSSSGNVVIWRLVLFSCVDQWVLQVSREILGSCDGLPSALPLEDSCEDGDWEPRIMTSPLRYTKTNISIGYKSVHGRVCLCLFDKAK